MTASVTVLGFDIECRVLDDCINEGIAAVRSDSRAAPLIAAFANPHSLVTASKDTDCDAALRSADLLFPDGAGVALAAALSARARVRRVTGTQFFLSLTAALCKTGGASYFFVGSTEATLQRLHDRLSAEFPAIRIVGMISPSYTDILSSEETDSIIARINAAAPDVLLVGMTAPKQEKWLAQNRSRLNVRVAAGIGATFDFYSRTVQRPPPWLGGLGLEWLGRLIKSPRRLWRRTFISAPVFIMRVLAAQWRLAWAKTRSPTRSRVQGT